MHRLTLLIAPLLVLHLASSASAQPSEEPPVVQTEIAPAPPNTAPESAGSATEDAIPAEPAPTGERDTVTAPVPANEGAPARAPVPVSPNPETHSPAPEGEIVAPKEDEDAATTANEQTAAPRDRSLEKPSPRQGHYIAVGLHGTAATANDPDRGRRGPAFGTGFSLRLGERITERLDLGLAVAYASVGGDNPWTFGRLTVHGQGYVTEKTFVHAGFGFGAAGGTDPEDPDFSRGRFGDVYTVGAGHNFYLTDKERSGGWIVSPVITAEYGRDDKFPNAGLWVGIEISRWWGIPRNQLDLDFDEAYKRR